MSTTDPDAIRAEIERTRAELSNDVNALAEHTNPKNIAENQVRKVKDKVADARDAIFGSPEDPYDDGKVGEIGDTIQGAAHDVKDKLTPDHNGPGAQQRLKGATRGRPLAAGLVAFAIGALIGGAAPSSRAEQRAASKIKDEAQPLVDDVKQAAQESATQLKAPAQQAVGELKDHASLAGERVKDVASEETGRVKDQATDAKDAVTDQAAESRRAVTNEVNSEDSPDWGDESVQDPFAPRSEDRL